MTINDQISDEKLHYDLNREAAKISALSSGKTHTHECLTGEGILPCNQQQIIEQTKFTYSPLGKAFGKQINTIEDERKKQIKVIQGEVKTVKKYSYDDKDTPFISKQKEIFNGLADERLKKITDLDERVNRNDLIHRYKSRIAKEKFDEFDNVLDIIDEIRDSTITLSDVKNNQEKFKSYLGEIKKGNNRCKSKEQKNTLCNIEMLYKTRNEAVKFYDNYSLMMSEAKTKATKIKGLKILTPKQMLQRLPIAYAQVKAGNNSESLLNETRQIVYTLYQSKQITIKCTTT